MLAVEVTTATLVAWGAAAVLVGFALGWALRPWAMADRTSREQAEALAAEKERRTAAETGLSATQVELDASTVDLTTARGEIVDLRHELENDAGVARRRPGATRGGRGPRRRIGHTSLIGAARRT